ncbi:TonB-dependent receptor plug domain-containing protein, partial [uncultured Muribaculum sp.]|uniref:TonB-dependent receptor plug domain-containing protein n=1 Tax=uncultured Muribaculum sp. TaxID=1918613 RepID=UPI0027313850
MISRNTILFPAIIGIVGASLSVTAAESEERVDSVKADDLVQVAFRKVDKNELLGGVSVLDMEDLQKTNYTYEPQNLEGYISGWNGNSIWGMDGDNDGGYLVLVDGVPRDMNNIPSDEIKSISFLKGAQAVVLYGSRAAKGVILITTKRGKEGPLTVSVRANTGWHVAKAYPEYLGSAEYMTLYNEARRNDGLSNLYSDEVIYHTAAKTNPYRYSDVNFYSDEYLKKVYNRTDADAEIYGGNERARFYTNINYFRQGDYLDFGEAKKNYTDRFSVRGNVDVNISKVVSAYVDASATFYGSRSGHGNYWQQAAMMRPNRVTPWIPVDFINPNVTGALDLINNSLNIRNGMFPAGTSIDKTNIFADYDIAGYTKFTSRQFQFDAGVNLDLNPLVKGLTFHTQFAVDYATTYNTAYKDTYAVFVPVWGNINGKEEIVGLTQEGLDKHTGSQSVSNSTSRQVIHFSGNFDYNRTFADVHNVHALAVVSGWQRTTAGQYHRTSSANIGFEVDYNYDRRYYADFGISGIHSAKLAPGHRQAWSPTGTIGWRISNEDFLKDSQVVNELMLSVSGGILHTDLDISNFYMYSANYTQGGWFSWAAGGYAATYPQRGANEDLTFIKRKEFSVNLRGQFFNNLLGLEGSFFVINNEGLLINNSTKFPSYFSTYYPESSLVPWLNFNNNRRVGFDFGVKINKQIGEVNLIAGVNGTYYDTKATKRDELNADAYQNREGKALDGIWGYRCAGFFNSEDEIKGWADQSALGGSNIQPGDLKYLDMN